MRAPFFAVFVITLFASTMCAQVTSAPTKKAATSKPSDRQLAISYNFRVDPQVKDYDEGDYEVTMTLEGLPTGNFEVAIPAWKPGSYRLLNSYKHVKDLRADSPQGKLRVKRNGKYGWQIEGDHGGRARIHYRGRTAKKLETWMALEGPEHWLYLVGGLRAPHRVSFELPANWRVATGLERQKTGEQTYYVAADFDTFADCPIELGEIEIHEFKVADTSYFLTYNISPSFSHRKMQAMCEKLIVAQSKLFGEVPWKNYYFMWQLQNQGNTGGGLEHLNSTTLAIPQFVMRKNVETMADLVSHEFFHAWNVKRIRPFELGPFDYSGPVRVKSLWFVEGVTDYYASRICRDAGIWDSNRLLADFKKEINSLSNKRAYQSESIEEASWKIWDRNYYSPQGLDYYNYGKIMGLLLDIEIRAASENKKSLDDVMRDLNQRFSLPKAGYRDSDLIDACSQAAGQDMSEFFANYVSGKKAIPFREFLAKAGILYHEERNPRRDRNAIGQMLPKVEVEAIESDDEDAASTFRVTSAPEDSKFKAGDIILRFNRKAPHRPRAKQTFIGYNANR
ncbi:MAG: hypothetical protein V3W41_18835, partial [Planctomycetota bacterium]